MTTAALSTSERRVLEAARKLAASEAHRTLLAVNSAAKAALLVEGGGLGFAEAIWATRDEQTAHWVRERGFPLVHFAHRHRNAATAQAYFVIRAIASGYLGKDDACLYVGDASNSGLLNQLMLFKPSEEYEIVQAIDWRAPGQAFDASVFLAVLELAFSLGSVRHSQVAGTMMTLGNVSDVLGISRRFLFDPFPFYERTQRNVCDPAIHKTVEKYTRLDGAFVLDWDGTIESVVQTINAPVPADKLPKGLGSRHTAGCAISSYCSAYVFVVSQSAGNVTVFKDGRALISLDQ